MAMILEGRSVVCETDELVYFELPINSTSGYISNPDEGQAGKFCGYCQYSSGEDVSSTICHEVDHSGLALNLLTVFGKVRAIGVIDLA